MIWPTTYTWPNRLNTEMTASRGSSRAAAAGDYDAVRLFVARAAAASPGFQLTDANASAVAAPCRQLDGLPLAIELAASRVRSFAPAELVEHLDHRFELLSDGARTAAQRHRTLRGAIDWSYHLLDPDEQALFEQLGVFPAGFDYPAVEAVCTVDGPSQARLTVPELSRHADDAAEIRTADDVRSANLLPPASAYAARCAVRPMSGRNSGATDLSRPVGVAGRLAMVRTCRPTRRPRHDRRTPAHLFRAIPAGRQ
jgi:hypothetical protein